MRSFIYKSIIASLKDKTDSILTKEGRRETVDKVRDEINKAINKDRYLSKEDAILLNRFIKKIKQELIEAENKELD